MAEEPVKEEWEEPEDALFVSKLGIEYPSTIRTDKVVAGSAALERTLEIDEDGLLVQVFAITVDDMPLGGGQWSFKKKGTRDEYIKLMDEHWEELCIDFKDAVRQGAYYHQIKEKTPDSDNTAFLRGFLQHIQETMLEQKFDDDDLVKDTATKAEMLESHTVMQPLEANKPADVAKGDEESDSDDSKPDNYEPLTTISDRLHAMRCTAEDNDYPLDRFEQFIMDTESQMQRIRDAYHNDGRSGGLQLTAGGPDDGEDWRSEAGDEDAHDPEAWRGDVHVAEATSYDDSEDDDEEKEEEPSTWQKSDDPAEEMKSEADMAMLKMSIYVEHFTNAANQIWTTTAAIIHRGNKIKRNDEDAQWMKTLREQIKLMETFRDKTKIAYEQFCDAVGDSPAEKWEQRQVFELFEDEKDGPIAKMQKAIDMASNPSILKAVIKKDMTKQRINPDGMGSP